MLKAVRSLQMRYLGPAIVHLRFPANTKRKNQIPQLPAKHPADSAYFLTEKIVMSQTKTTSPSLQTCQQYIGQCLTGLYTIDLEKLNVKQHLQVLQFYGQLVDLLYNNAALFSNTEFKLIICPPE